MSAEPKKPAAEQGPSRRPAAPNAAEMPADVLELVQAIDDYKRLHDRPFPSWSEVLEVIKELGYQKVR